MHKKYLLSLLLLCAFWSLSEVSAQHRHRRPRPDVITNPGVHDPVLAREDSTYYLFSTGWNVSCMSSTDLVHWRFLPPIFKNPPTWALQSVPGYRGHTWAPDMLYHQGKWHLFYSCSSFGKNTSAIGHAERTTLNPSDTLNLWRDTGPVVTSTEGRTNYNAIDPSVLIDAEGRAWMSYGSFWGGIQLVRLTPDLTACDTTFTRRTIARRRTGQAIEAPFLFRHGEYYYLFVSYDFCCRGAKSNYKVAVGRSRQVEGPYVDREGVEMTAGGGTVILTGDSTFVAAGHSAAYTFDGQDLFVAHGYSRREHGASLLLLRRMEWDAEGWPVLKPYI